MSDVIKSSGIVEVIISYRDGKDERFEQTFEVRNRILRTGRIDLVKALANDFGLTYSYFITGITFGSGGTVDGAPRYIDETRSGLFGPTVITKPVISSINSDFPTQVTFTSVLTYDEAVGSIINEMALRMANGEYFSMTTFGDLTKTSSMQTTFNWKISIV
jgi:hypothetical protein